MSNMTISRLSGLALMMAFLLSLAGGLLHPVIENESHSVASFSQPEFPAAHFLLFLGGAFLLIGLPGLYARIAPKAGIVGLLGFTLYFLANATVLQGVAVYDAFIAPVLVSNPTTSGLIAPDGALASSTPFVLLQVVGGLVFMLGMLLLGITIVRSRVFPVWTGVLMAAAPVLFLLPIPETPILTGLLFEVPRGLAVAAIGYTLFTQRKGEEVSATLLSGGTVAGAGRSEA